VFVSKVPAAEDVVVGEPTTMTDDAADNERRPLNPPIEFMTPPADIEYMDDARRAIADELTALWDDEYYWDT
jgi:hypothetical protein